MRILLLDYQPVFRYGLVRLLDAEPDIEVVWAGGDPLEAVRQAGELRPDVVVLDCESPTMPASEVARCIKTAAPEVAILALGISRNEDSIFQMLKAGAVSYMLKERELDELVSAIRSAARGDAVLDPAVTLVVVGYLRNLGNGTRAGGVTRSNELTKREVDVIQLVCRGYSNKQIAAEMALSDRTVENHLRNIYDKLDVSDRTQAVLHAIQTGIVSLALPNHRRFEVAHPANHHPNLPGSLRSSSPHR